MSKAVTKTPFPFADPCPPQRLCSSCRTGTFFVTYGSRLLSLICTNCHRPVIVSLERRSWQNLTTNTLKKGD